MASGKLPKLNDEKELEVLALALERHAAQRFTAMAAAMETRGREDLQQLFLRLAEQETQHAARLREAAPDLPAETDQPPWPAALGPEPSLPDPLELARSSVYQCLAEAVRNEVKAFRFYSYLAAESDDPVLVRKAEALAKEELAHAALLRTVRRQAYRQQPREAWPLGQEISSLAELSRAALPQEVALRRRLMDTGLDAATTAALAQASDRILAALGHNPEEPEESLQPAGTPPPPLDQELDAAFAFYDWVAGNAGKEAVMLAAQRLAALAVERITLLAGKSDAG